MQEGEGKGFKCEPGSGGVGEEEPPTPLRVQEGRGGVSVRVKEGLRSKIGVGPF